MHRGSLLQKQEARMKEWKNEKMKKWKNEKKWKKSAATFAGCRTNIINFINKSKNITLIMQWEQLFDSYPKLVSAVKSSLGFADYFIKSLSSLCIFCFISFILSFFLFFFLSFLLAFLLFFSLRLSPPLRCSLRRQRYGEKC